jgi:hypothetical protein
VRSRPKWAGTVNAGPAGANHTNACSPSRIGSRGKLFSTWALDSAATAPES